MEILIISIIIIVFAFTAFKKQKSSETGGVMSDFEKLSQNVDESIEQYTNKLRAKLEKETGNLNDLKAERERLESELGLGVQLSKFMERVYYFCAWDENGSTPWRSVTVNKSDVLRKKIKRDHSSYGRPLTDDDEEREKLHQATIYKFCVENVDYRVIFYDDSDGCSLPDGDYYSYKVLEVYKGERVVYLTHISCDIDDYGCERHRSSLITAFIPGTWVEYLLKKCKELEREDAEWKVKDEYSEDKMGDLKRNFVE